VSNLYNGVCYENYISAAQAEQADGYKTTADQVTWITGIVASGTDNTANLTISYKPTSATAASSMVIAKTYPECGNQPYDYTIGSSFGMSVSDVNLTAWAVVLVWIAAWAFKNALRR
jgi:hypothetical protein